MLLRIITFIFLFIALGFNKLSAQNENLVELSGVVLASDSLQPVFYCNIGVVGTSRGTISDLNGFFSIVMRKGETVQFSAIGYQDVQFEIPDTIVGNRYSLIQLMTNDTYNIPETLIFPWPKPHEFKAAFMSLDIPDDDITRARKNLDNEMLRQIAYTMEGDGGENWAWALKDRTTAYWTFNQPRQINLLNPFAWAQFIKAWKRGDFKRKKNK